MLAQHRAAYSPASIVSSREPKAAETAALLAAGLHTSARFAAAVEREVAAAPGNVIIVAHGTVIALFVARCCGIAPFPLWQRLGLPSYVVLALPSHALVAVRGDIDGTPAL